MKRTGTSSIAARSWFKVRIAPRFAERRRGSGPAGVCIMRRARREDSSRARRARRAAAHLAEYADRRLVARGARFHAYSLRLHQHANGREECRPQFEIRRDSFSAGRPRRESGLDHQRTADRVGQSAAVEEDTETPNIGKNDSTDDTRPGLGWEGVAHLQNS